MGLCTAIPPAVMNSLSRWLCARLIAGLTGLVGPSTAVTLRRMGDAHQALGNDAAAQSY